VLLTHHTDSGNHCFQTALGIACRLTCAYAPSKPPDCPAHACVKPLRWDQWSKSASNDYFGIAHDPFNQLSASGYIVYQALNLAGPDKASIHVATFQRRSALAPGYETADILENCARFIENFHYSIWNAVRRHPCGGFEAAEDHSSRPLVIGDNELLYRVVDRSLTGCTEARTDIDALSAERKGRRKPSPIAEATARDDRCRSNRLVPRSRWWTNCLHLIRF
jgi:hypothetical protein